MISELLAEEDINIGDTDKIHCDLLNRIKQDRLNIRSQLLQQKISEAESNGDQDTLEQLREEFQELMKLKLAK